MTDFYKVFCVGIFASAEQEHNWELGAKEKLSYCQQRENDEDDEEKKVLYEHVYCCHRRRTARPGWLGGDQWPVWLSVLHIIGSDSLESIS